MAGPRRGCPSVATDVPTTCKLRQERPTPPHRQQRRAASPGRSYGATKRGGFVAATNGCLLRRPKRGGFVAASDGCLLRRPKSGGFVAASDGCLLRRPKSGGFTAATDGCLLRRPGTIDRCFSEGSATCALSHRSGRPGSRIYLSFLKRSSESRIRGVKYLAKSSMKPEVLVFS